MKGTLVRIGEEAFALLLTVRGNGEPRDWSVRIGDTPVPRPLVLVHGALEGGGRRLLLAFRVPAALRAAQPGLVTARADAGAGVMVEVTADTPPDAAPALEPAMLLGGMAPAHRAGVLRRMLDVVGLHLRLGDDGRFAACCRALAAALAPESLRPAALVALTGRLFLARVPLPAHVGAVASLHVAGRAALRRNPFLPRTARPDRTGCVDLLVERADALGDGPFCVVLAGDGGIARLHLDPGRAQPLGALPAMLEQRKADAAAVRGYLTAGLKPYFAAAPELEDALRVAAALLPVKERWIAPGKAPLAARVEDAVPVPGGGVFLRGWLADPHGLVEGMTLVTASGERRPFGLPPHRQPRPDLAGLPGLDTLGPGPAPGFVAYVDGLSEPEWSVPYGVELRLRGGAVLPLTAPPPPAGPAERLRAVLGSVAHEALDEELIAACLAPAAAALQAARLDGERVAGVVTIGAETAAPDVSIIVPLYRNLTFLRQQIAALSADPETAGAELILVLDSPEQRAAVEGMLRGLETVYGFACTLAVHTRNLGYAPAVNTGAGLARGRWLVLLNSDVVPAEPGWLGRMRAAAARDGVGAVGPKLLFDDDSLQHAGLYFWRDPRGRWFNRHFHKGYPCRWPAADVARAVPGVTGACVLIARERFAAVGGLSESYIVGDYEDSDLCLRLHEAGLSCWYEPSAVLYHFERQSIMKHDGYTRTAASEYNRWLHATRWAARMEAVMAACPGA